MMTIQPNVLANAFAGQGYSAKISARIVAHVANGVSLKDAIDAVLGPGVYMMIAADLWNALRAQEVK